MNKQLSLIIIVAALATSCTSTRISKANDPRERFNYPLVIETSTPIDKAWTKLIDLVAVKGYYGGLDNVNGLFTGKIMNVPYAIEGSTVPGSDTAAFVMLPRLRFQEIQGGRVRKSRIIYPDTVSIEFNVRIRSNGSSTTFINVNISNITVAGAHYNKKQSSLANITDTTTVQVPAAVKPSDWSSAKSTGKLEKYIIQHIKEGQIGKYWQ